MPTGRYRRGQERRSKAWRVKLAASTLVITLTVLLFAAINSGDPANDAIGRAVDEPGTWRTEHSEGTSRGTGRSDGDGRTGIEPIVSATVLGPVINGRLQPPAVDPPQSASGRYEVVAGESRPPKRESEAVLRYIVEVEDGLPFDDDEFAADVHRILNDERGWGHDGSVRFRRVDDGDVSFRVSLSSADMTDEQCYPLLTQGRVSCWNGTRAVINAERWGSGSETFRGDILTYREYLINHEVGHALGHGHVKCPKRGQLAPVMVQQTKSLEGCKANPWPSR